jgi:hypothetical protein
MKNLFILCTALLCIVSCKNISSENVKVTDIENSPMRGYIYRLENNTDKTIYYYGIAYNIPWIFIELDHNNKWIDYGKCHYSDDLKIYSIAPQSSMDFLFPWIDYKRLGLSYEKPRHARVKFPYAFSKEAIQPVSADLKNKQWNYSYGEFDMPPVSSALKNKPTDKN